MWVHNAECCDLGIGEINPRTGHKVLASHKIEASSNSDYIIEATKPSAKGKLVNTKTQYYENPGHHDPKGGGNVGYNSTKSVLPENHIELWNKSVIPKIDGRLRQKIAKLFIIDFKMMEMAIFIGMAQLMARPQEVKQEPLRLMMSPRS